MSRYGSQFDLDKHRDGKLSAQTTCDRQAVLLKIYAALLRFMQRHAGGRQSNTKASLEPCISSPGTCL